MDIPIAVTQYSTHQDFFLFWNSLSSFLSRRKFTSPFVTTPTPGVNISVVNPMLFHMISILSVKGLHIIWIFLYSSLHVALTMQCFWHSDRANSVGIRLNFALYTLYTVSGISYLQSSWWNTLAVYSLSFIDANYSKQELTSWPRRDSATNSYACTLKMILFMQTWKSWPPILSVHKFPKWNEQTNDGELVRNIDIV